MEFKKLIVKAMKGRTIYRAAKDWGIPITTLTRFVKGDRLPNFSTAEIIADEAGVERGQMLEILAREERRNKKAALLKHNVALDGK